MDSTITGQCCSNSGSRIFEGFRSLGHVSNHVPCILRYIHRRRENFIISCIGKSFNTYASQKLKLLSVCETLNEEISCMVADTYHVYTGAGNKIYAWRRGTELKYVYIGHTAQVVQTLPFGEHLLSFDLSGELRLWDIKSEECTWSQNFNVKDFKPIMMMHPSTYINKILIASEQGSLQLWNIRTAKLIHSFKGWSTEVTFIAQAPAVDVVAIALANNSIVLYNLRYEETLFKLKCIDKPISLAFRTDGPAVLLVGSSTGTITMWDLENKEVVSFVENAHQASVTGLQCFLQEPIFASSSPDNSVKIWIFDMPDGSFRLLNTRDGHQEPSNRIRFHGTKGYNILSAGQDSSFRKFHIYNETYNCCLSKNKIPLYKMTMQRDYNSPSENFVPPILDFTVECVANPNHHDDIAACHIGQVGLSTWSVNNQKRGKELLILPKYKNVPKPNVSAMCLCLTRCGQFVIVGYDDGTVERFNIQSHKHRKSYGSPAHKDLVSGVAVDHVNSTVLSASVEAVLHFWNFKTGELKTSVKTNAGVSFVFQHRTSNMVGAALDNFSIVIIDLITTNIIRRLSNLSDVILDAKFSPNCAWVTASTGDCLVRTWDLSTSNMIDIFRLESIVSSLDYSPNGEFLATALSDNVGILLWMNKTLFSHVSLMPISPDYEPILLSTDMKSAVEMETIEEDFDEEFQSPAQINENLITLSLLPESRWKNLLNLDVIRMRNRPKEPPKTYVAPFFLSNLMEKPVQATNDTFINNTESDKQLDSGPTSKISTFSINRTAFGVKLMKEDKSSDDYIELCRMMESMGPSKVDIEIRALGPEGGGSIAMLNEYMKFMVEIVKTRKFFEGSQSYLALFLKVHGATLIETSDLSEELRSLKRVVAERDDDFNSQINSVLAYSAFIKSSLFL